MLGLIFEHCGCSSAVLAVLVVTSVVGSGGDGCSGCHLCIRIKTSETKFQKEVGL